MTIPSFLAQTDSNAIQTMGSSSGTPAFPWLPLLVILIGAVSYLLIQEGVIRSKSLLLGGILGALLTAGVSAGLMPFSLPSYITFCFFALATGGAVGFLSAREPVNAALGFATAVLSTCGILFMQSALFIAAATMIVYAGATIIIFLFVLMFAQQSQLRPYDINLTNPYLATVIGAIMLVAISVCVLQPGAIPAAKVDTTRLLSEATTLYDVSLPNPSSGSATVDAEVANVAVNAELAQETGKIRIPETTAELGRSLYTDYLAAIELAGAVLLVATIGAIALATRSPAEVNG